MANFRRKFNAIRSICVDGECLDDPPLIKGAIVNFYTNLLHEDLPRRPFFEGLSFDTISDEDAFLMDFSEEEVWKTISNLGKEKAPGPDGFNIAFFQHCWDIVKEDVMGLFLEFHSKGVFEKSLNATFISLIPKVVGTNDISKFRPISLVESVYKILAKVLASRLRSMVAKVVSPNQHAFVHGRQILDAFLIANECIDYYLKSNQAGVLCKFDIEKAFDHVSWEFLLTILEKIGFPEKWRRWISFCISIVRYSVLINGEATGFFSSSKGL